MNVIDCSKCIHCEVCGNRYANDGYAGECSYFSEHNPTGDCISREALRNVILNDSKLDGANANWEVNRILVHIDNAPTVPERDYRQGWHDAITKALNEAYTITTEDGSFKVVQTETLEGLGMSMPMPERPKGEWTITKLQHGEDVTCPFCNARPTKSEYGYYLRDNFCHECGADMRKGGAE